MRRTENLTIKTSILVAGLCGLFGTVNTARAQETTETQRTAGGMKEERERRLVGTIDGIDKDARTVTLTDEEGNKRTVKVSPSLKGFDRLKVGDKVNVTYTEAMAVSLGKPGEKPSTSTQEGTASGGPHTGAAVRQTEATAEVVAVDQKKHQVTIKKPDGTTDTVTVEDPSLREKMTKLKAGDTIQVTYTETVAGSITPAKKK